MTLALGRIASLQGYAGDKKATPHEMNHRGAGKLFNAYVAYQTQTEV